MKQDYRIILETLAGSHMYGTSLPSSDIDYCFYCGCVGMNITRQYKEFPHNGIDRINNNKGYTQKNCLPCCKVCNFAKNTMKYKEFISWSKRLYENLKIKGVY